MPLTIFRSFVCSPPQRELFIVAIVPYAVRGRRPLEPFVPIGPVRPEPVQRVEWVGEVLFWSLYFCLSQVVYRSSSSTWVLALVAQMGYNR